MPTHKLSQMDLVLAIAKFLEKKYGIKDVSVKQMNAVCQASSLIVDKFAEPHKAATPWMGEHRWINCDDAGASSKYLLRVLIPRMPWAEVPRYACPLDAADLERCRLMILACAANLPKNLFDSTAIFDLVMEHPEWAPWIEKLKAQIPVFPPPRNPPTESAP